MKFTPLPCVLLLICCVVLSSTSLALPLVLRFNNTFPWLRIRESKVSLLVLKFLLDLGDIVICRAKRCNVEELHFLLNVIVQTVAILEHQSLYESLISNFVRRVWNKFVSSCTS